MINQNWWFTTLLVKQFTYCPPLNKDIKCDVLVVGGGMSGISAAAEFLRQGLKVVVIDKNIIGGSSTGRSAGFLTPDSELELHQLVRRYGVEAARDIWEMPCRGIDRLVENIKKFEVECGLLKQDSLFLGLGKSGKEAVVDEMKCRQDVGFTDQVLYDEAGLKGIIGAEKFTGGIRYTGTYGVNPLLCVQGFKDILLQHGMQVFESTAMERLEGHTVYTHAGSITADHIILAADKPERSISVLADEVFHAQTFLSVTEPLNDRELAQLFPGGEQMQCWDSQLVYSYFRLTGDNRLLLGGGTAVTTFMRNAYNNPGIIKRVIRGFKEHFPFLRDLSFIQFWPGLIDTSRDLLPIITRLPKLPHVQLIMGVVGLPWAAFAGGFAARCALGNAADEYRKYYPYFTNRRHFFLPSGLGRIIGKPLLFSLNNGWAKYYQVDTHRRPVEMIDEF